MQYITIHTNFVYKKKSHDKPVPERNIPRRLTSDKKSHPSLSLSQYSIFPALARMSATVYSTQFVECVFLWMTVALHWEAVYSVHKVGRKRKDALLYCSGELVYWWIRRLAVMIKSSCRLARKLLCSWADFFIMDRAMMKGKLDGVYTDKELELIFLYPS